MTVTVTIPLSRLEDPEVNTALRVLLDAVARRLGAQGGAAAEYEAQVDGSLALSGPAALATLATIVAPAVTKEAAPTQAPPEGREAGAVPASAPTSEDWTRFVEGLPERTQRFLALVQEKGLLTIDEAMTLLGITEPKALGGITGAIGRWAPQRGFEMPYETLSIGGRRAWRWLNVPGQSIGEAPAAAPPPAAPPPAAPPPAVDPSPYTAATKAAKATKPAAAERPAAKAPDFSAYQTAPAGLSTPKPVAAPAIPVASETADNPYAAKAEPAPQPAKAEAAPKPAKIEPAKIEPAKIEAPKPAKAEPAPKPAKVEPAKAEPAPKAEPAASPSTAATVATDIDPMALTQRIVALLTELPENSRRFLALLDERGRLTMDEVLAAFGLDRPKAAGRIVEPIDRLFRSHGLDLPYDKDRGEDGRRIWLRKVITG